MSSFDHAFLRDVAFAHQVQRLRMRLAVPNTKSACAEKPRFHWTEPSIHEPRNTLEPDDVINIHRLIAAGASVKGLAQKYHVRVRQIERIRDGKSWKSLWPGASTHHNNGSVGPDGSLRGEKGARPAQFVGTQGNGRASREARLERHAALRTEA